MPNGSLRVDGFLTRSGVFPYRTGTGAVRHEWRPPDEVFKTDSLESAQLAPFTDDHPPGLINPENARKHQVGTIGESVRRDGDWVAAPIIVMDAATIRKMRGGKHELSCGYDCDLEEKSGTTPSGERYDAIQRNIRYNHVALVDVARAGRGARVRMDGVAVRVDSDEGTQPAAPALPRRQDHMSKTKDKLTLEQAAELLAKAEERADAADAKVAELEAQIDKSNGEAAALRTRLDTAEKEIKEAPDASRYRAEIAKLTERVKRFERKERTDAAEAPAKFQAAVNRRIEVLGAAAAILGVGERFDSIDNRGLELAVIERLGHGNCGEKSDEYVSMRFDVAVEGWHSGREANEKLAALVGQHGADQEKPTSQASRDAMVERQRNAWKPREQQAAK